MRATFSEVVIIHVLPGHFSFRLLRLFSLIPGAL